MYGGINLRDKYVQNDEGMAKETARFMSLANYDLCQRAGIRANLIAMHKRNVKYRARLALSRRR